MDYKRFITPLVFICFFGALFFLSALNAKYEYNPKSDHGRYISYAVSMDKTGTFGLSSNTPGNANAPIYPSFLYLAMQLDQNLEQSFYCRSIEERGTNCTDNYKTLFLIQSIIALLTLFLIFHITKTISKKDSVAWVASILAFVSGILQETSTSIITENFVLPAFALLALITIKTYKNPKILHFVITGIILGILTLIRPSYLYLTYAYIGFWFIYALIHKNKNDFIRLSTLTLAFILSVVPWATRNVLQFNAPSLTSGDYAEAILIERSNYNQMSWPEIGVAMIYWLPDFGDNLAKSLFSENLYKKLGWDEGTYYGQRYRTKLKALEQDLGSKDKILPHLIKTEVLSLKHIATSIPLAVRGVFIAKYWGLIGFIAFVSLLISSTLKRDYFWLAFSAPFLFMVAFHAGLSVSVPRYNLPLIILYALSMAWYIDLYGRKIKKA